MTRNINISHYELTYAMDSVSSDRDRMERFKEGMIHTTHNSLNSGVAPAAGDPNDWAACGLAKAAGPEGLPCASAPNETAPPWCASLQVTEIEGHTHTAFSSIVKEVKIGDCMQIVGQRLCSNSVLYFSGWCLVKVIIRPIEYKFSCPVFWT